MTVFEKEGKVGPIHCGSFLVSHHVWWQLHSPGWVNDCSFTDVRVATALGTDIIQLSLNSLLNVSFPRWEAVSDQDWNFRVSEFFLRGFWGFFGLQMPIAFSVDLMFSGIFDSFQVIWVHLTSECVLRMGTHGGCLLETLNTLGIGMQTLQGQKLSMLSVLYSSCKGCYFLGYCLIEIKLNIISWSYNIL